MSNAFSRSKWKIFIAQPLSQPARLVKVGSITMNLWQQKLVFVSLYVAYLKYSYVRRCVTFALPDIAKSEELDKNQMDGGRYDLSHIWDNLLTSLIFCLTVNSLFHSADKVLCMTMKAPGLILSSQMVAYAASKFVSGIMMDFVSPRLALSFFLAAAGVTVILFACVHGSVILFTTFWFLNGLAGGPGWPAAALIMKKWFRKDQFGTAWSILSTSMNVAGTLGPLVTAFIVMYAGWRTSLICAGVVAICVSFVILLTVRDKPNDDIEIGQNTQQNESNGNESEQTISRLDLLKLPGYFGVCFTYGLVSLVQYGTLQWGPLYLINDMGHSIITGNSYVSSLEVGGICGSLMAGYYSDYLLTQRKNEASQDVRQYVIAWFACGLAVFLSLLSFCVTSNSSLMWINLIGFGLGMMIYGPISIYGVVAIECAPSHMAGTAHAIAALFANSGQTLAGLPLSYVAKFWGWQMTFLIQLFFVIAMAAYLFLYTSCMKHKTSRQQKPD